MMQEYLILIPEQDRTLRFNGDLLAHASSDDGTSQRWTDFDLYRTDTGRYVLHKVGKSVVYHTNESRCTRQAKPATVQDLLSEDGVDWLGCVSCNPVDVYDGMVPPEFTLLVEQDRHQTVVSESARGVVEQLHGKDKNGSLFLTKVAERLVVEAAKKDSGIRQAWEVQTV